MSEERKNDRAAPSPGGGKPDPEPSAAATPTPKAKEIGGRKGPDPTRYGDWEKNGRCVDF